jgi:uncharacterized protein (DUF433 family)
MTILTPNRAWQRTAAGGRPCIRRYRMCVKDVLDLLAARVPEVEILADYPFLEPEDIQACLE